MELKRRNFQGVLNILSFNRHFYYFGAGLLVTIVATHLIFDYSIAWFWFVISAVLFGLIMPLIVSAYVYDFSGYYNMDWLEKYNITDTKAKHIVNINAGFDETSYLLKDHFPQAHLSVFDFYDAGRHTEPAIIRARKVSVVFPNTQTIPSNHIPLKDQSADVIFLLSAAHEIRSNEEKIQFLKECKRICRSNGKVVTVEHLRDLPNFLAFTIGFTHFFSRKVWVNAFKCAGLSTFEEVKFTPFMSIFICKP